MPATTIDTHAVHELILFADNTYGLYPQKQACIASVQRRITKGTYDPILAIKLWRYWMTAASRQYCHEFGCSPATFPLAVRTAAAKEVSEREYEAILNGEYTKG